MPQGSTTVVGVRTETATIHPIIAALEAAQRLAEMPSGLAWHGRTAAASSFLSRYLAKGLDDLPSVADCLYGQAEWVGPPALIREFAALSRLQLSLTWKVSGTTTEIVTPDGRSFPALALADNTFLTLEHPHHGHPIAMIRTTNGDHVFATVVDRPDHGFDLVERALELTADARCLFRSHDRLEMPMIRLLDRPDLNWILGTTATRLDAAVAVVSRAEQETELRLNQVGLRLVSRVSLRGTLLGSSDVPSVLRIDRPFMLWVMRPNVGLPIFAGFLAHDCWSNPGQP